MERSQERLQLAKKALDTLSEVLKVEHLSSIERDAAVHRFKIGFEACWKAGKQYLYDIEGLDIGSPKGVIRSFREVGLLSDDETVHALKMADDRNLTVHTYNEQLSIQIFGMIPDYYRLLCEWIERLNNGL